MSPMPHRTLEKYLKNVESKILSIKDCYFEKYEVEFLGWDRVNVRIRIRFINGFLLDISEAVIIVENAISHLTYKYHLQNGKNELVFRYDNTPHFPHLDTFPHHLHLPNVVVGSPQPDIIQILNQTINTISRVASQS